MIAAVTTLFNNNDKLFPWYSTISLKLFVPWVHVIYTYSKQGQIWWPANLLDPLLNKTAKNGKTKQTVHIDLQAVHIDLWYPKNPSFHRIYMKSDFLCLGERKKKLTYGNRVNVDRWFCFRFSFSGHKSCFR